MKPEFSIIIPTYNSERTIAQLLDSIYRQTFKDFEVIVVDDNSSDSTRDILAGYPVRAVTLRKNRGPAYVRNHGARQAEADTLVFFDSDVILYEDVMMRFHERFKDGAIKVLLGMYAEEPANKGFISEFKALQEQIWYSRIPEDKAAPFTAYAGAIRKNIFMDINGFNEDYSDADVEDYEFSIDLLKKSRIHLDKNIKVKHYFPGFKKLVISYFRRCFLWTEVFLEQKRFDTNGTTLRQGCIYIAYNLSILFFVFSVLDRRFAGIGFLFMCSAFYLDRDFLGFFYQKKGLWFCLKAMFLNMFFSLAIVPAAASGLIYYFLKGIFVKKPAPKSA